jgi:hypothetical protein
MLGKGKDTDIGYVIPSLVVFLKGMIGISVESLLQEK